MQFLVCRNAGSHVQLSPRPHRRMDQDRRGGDTYLKLAGPVVHSRLLQDGELLGDRGLGLLPPPLLLVQTEERHQRLGVQDGVRPLAIWPV